MPITDSEIQEMRDAAKRERDRIINEAQSTAEANYEKTLEAIDIVAKLPRNGQSNPYGPAPVKRVTTAKPRAWPGLRGAIREAFQNGPEIVMLDDIIGYIDAQYGKTVEREKISVELWRMKKAQEIVVVEAGAGRKPGKYRRANELVEVTVK